MKVIIFNNTSKYHKGCAKVMDYIHNNLTSNNHTIIKSIYGNGTYQSVSDYKQEINTIQNGNFSDDFLRKLNS